VTDVWAGARTFDWPSLAGRGNVLHVEFLGPDRLQGVRLSTVEDLPFFTPFWYVLERG
jgi:hypothetical protein